MRGSIHPVHFRYPGMFGDGLTGSRNLYNQGLKILKSKS